MDSMYLLLDYETVPQRSKICPDLRLLLETKGIPIGYPHNLGDHENKKRRSFRNKKGQTSDSQHPDFT